MKHAKNGVAAAPADHITTTVATTRLALDALELNVGVQTQALAQLQRLVDQQRLVVAAMRTGLGLDDEPAGGAS